MYSDKVLDHFLNPRNVGQLSDPDGIGQVGDPSCGDCLRIYIKVKNNRIDEICFVALGCPAAIATSSAFTELVKNKTLGEALEITDSEVVSSLGGVPDLKVHCSTLGTEALRRAVKDYLERQGKKRVTKSSR